MHTTQQWEDKFGPREHAGNNPLDSTQQAMGISKVCFPE